MFYLDIQPVRTTSALQGAANADDLQTQGYTVEDGYVIVETQTDADALINRYSNLELDLEAGAERTGDLERATIETPDESEPDTCQEIKGNGEVCGRDRPCRYHD